MSTPRRYEHWSRWDLTLRKFTLTHTTEFIGEICATVFVVPVKDGAALKCQTCHRVYPIKDDIPVMLLDEATVEP